MKSELFACFPKITSRGYIQSSCNSFYPEEGPRICGRKYRWLIYQIAPSEVDAGWDIRIRTRYAWGVGHSKGMVTSVRITKRGQFWENVFVVFIIPLMTFFY